MIGQSTNIGLRLAGEQAAHSGHDRFSSKCKEHEKHGSAARHDPGAGGKS